ncbi:MAG: hypothetical protein NT027_18570 [Proteobacteria bacterium]|nr:hypothetical protein [Pseudomonadota bacterium]
MEHILARLKAVILVVLLMLIATRLTWLQTSEIPIDISPTFYKTGLWISEYIKESCPVSPEATFPIPAALAIKPDFIPPDPELGELSPGMALLVLSKCQLSRIDVDDFAKWNAWLFMASTLFSAIAARLLTRSWTAGLLAAVSILSRGTLQSKSMYVSAEPFAGVLISASVAMFILYFRTQWMYWLVISLLCVLGAVAFIPSLFFICLPIAFLPLVLLWVTKRPILEGFEALKALPEYRFLSRPTTLEICKFLAINIALLIAFAVLIRKTQYSSPVIFGDLNLLKIDYQQFNSFLSALIAVIGKTDAHTFLAFGLIFTQIKYFGQLSSTNKFSSLLFLTMISAHFIHVLWGVLTQGHIGTSVSQLLSMAKSFEPVYFAWSTAAGWRIFDHITGYRVSKYGWSIRAYKSV